MFAITARDTQNWTVADAIAGKLSGTNLDFTNLAANFGGMDKQTLSSIVWFLLVCIPLGIASTRIARSFKPALFVIAFLMPVGWYAGFVNVFAAWSICILLMIAGVFSISWKSTS
jgi:hypothetical protein